MVPLPCAQRSEDPTGGRCSEPKEFHGVTFELFFLKHRDPDPPSYVGVSHPLHPPHTPIFWAGLRPSFLLAYFMGSSLNNRSIGPNKRWEQIWKYVGNVENIKILMWSSQKIFESSKFFIQMIYLLQPDDIQMSLFLQPGIHVLQPDEQSTWNRWFICSTRKSVYPKVCLNKI